MAKREEKATESTRGPIQDLREWLERVEETGDLVRVKEAVSCEEEMSAIGYLVAKQKPSPAILFDNIKGYEKSPYKAQSLWNILGPSIPRIALTMEEPHDTPTVELIRRTKDKLKNRMAPREISAAEAPMYQNTLTGDKIDITQLPIPRHWPLDGGRYAGTDDAPLLQFKARGNNFEWQDMRVDELDADLDIDLQGAGHAQQGAGACRLPAKAWCLYACLYDDAEEAELGPA